MLFCAGFLRSQNFEQLTFTYKNQRTLALVPGFQYDIECSDNGAEPVWHYNGHVVTDIISSATYQISEATNRKTLKFSDFSTDQVGAYVCSVSCGNCTIDISAGKIRLVVRVQDCVCMIHTIYGFG